MTPELIIALAAVIVAVAAVWFAQRNHSGDKLDAKLDGIDGKLDQLSDDFAELRTKVAVHDDRFNRPPYLAAVRKG